MIYINLHTVTLDRKQIQHFKLNKFSCLVITLTSIKLSVAYFKTNTFI